ncbi:MAG: hypothetical protein EA398_04085 [Deltaproteobacteria bacterium]|nr:MAG: hypothetical protein EA398_04085 [Deltaproteobacteria bacterium]
MDLQAPVTLRRALSPAAHAAAVSALALFAALVPSGLSVASAGDRTEPAPDDDSPVLVVAAELFGGLHLITGPSSFSEFELGRAELTTALSPVPWAGFELTAEAIRSATSESVLGVDGDSLVFRVKRAWAHASAEIGPLAGEARVGLIPDPFVEAVESDYAFRGLAPLLAERGSFFDTSDLGAAGLVHALDGQVGLHLAITNGEGRNRVEQNSGKNTTALLSLAPRVLETRSGDAHLALHVAYRDGSVGTAGLRNHRLAGALAFSHPRVSTGVEAVRAWGYAGRAARETFGAGLWAGGTVVPRWGGVVGRAEILDMDLDRDETWRFRGTAGLFADLLDAPDPREAERLRLYAVVQFDRATERAAPLPGAAEAHDETRLMLLFSARGRHAVR